MEHLAKRKKNNFDSQAKAVAAAFVQYSCNMHTVDIMHTPRNIIKSLTEIGNLQTRSSGFIPDICDLTQGFGNKKLCKQMTLITDGKLQWSECRLQEFVEDGGKLAGGCFDFRLVGKLTTH
jgi:hypothetical protein